MGKTDLTDQFRIIIISYKRMYYNLNVMRQYACLVINPVSVDDHAALFNCTPVGRRWPRHKAYQFNWLVPEMVVFGSPWIPNCHKARCIS